PLYRSDDRGTTWHVVSHDHSMAERAPYYVRFAVAPDDEERLYFVSVRFSMSRDGGRTLARSGYEGGGDNHDIWIDPLNPDRFMVAHDGGASITLNRGRTFMRIALPIAQMYHVHVDTRAPYFVYGNRQDGSSYRMPSRGLGEGISEGAWQHVGGCESGFGIPDTVDNATVWSGCYDGGLEVYDVRTGHARNVRVWPEAGYGWRPADLKYRWNWTFPIMISPHDHRRVYVGSQYVHVTSDGGASWKVVSPDLTRNDTSHQQNSGGVTTDNLMTFDGATLFALAESPVQAGVIWAGSNDGVVVATYGRGIWILDDISPLEDPALTGAPALTGRAMLFAPRPAFRFRAQQGIASAPNSAVRVDSVPEGADLTYYLPAALADTAAVPDSAHRRRPAKLVILGASGDTVRVLEGERKPGLN